MRSIGKLERAPRCARSREGFARQRKNSRETYKTKSTTRKKTRKEKELAHSTLSSRRAPMQSIGKLERAPRLARPRQDRPEKWKPVFG